MIAYFDHLFKALINKLTGLFMLYVAVSKLHVLSTWFNYDHCRIY